MDQVEYKLNCCSNLKLKMKLKVECVQSVLKKKNWIFRLLNLIHVCMVELCRMVPENEKVIEERSEASAKERMAEENEKQIRLT